MRKFKTKPKTKQMIKIVFTYALRSKAHSNNQGYSWEDHGALQVIGSQNIKRLVMNWSQIYIMVFLYAYISQWHGMIAVIYPDTSGYQLLGLVTSI